MITTDELFQDLKEQFRKIVEENNLLYEPIAITGRPLTTEEAIGNPERQDFPLIKGKERLLQATFKDSIGQAFTSMPDCFEGELVEIINQPLKNDFDRAVFVTTLNAVMSYLGLIDCTIHCKDNEPEDCAIELVTFLKESYDNSKVALIGLQPSFLEQLVSFFEVRVLDLDPKQVGTEKFGVKIEDGKNNLQDVLDWCDVILATGSTLVNGTIGPLINAESPVILYGTTIAGGAHLLDLKRYCKYAK